MAQPGGGAFLMAEALSAERPKTVATILQSRARRSRVVAECLADYLQERMQIEETYVRGLQKLQRKPIIPESYGLHLGSGLDRLRKRFDTDIEEIIQIHEAFAQKVDKEVIAALQNQGRTGETALKQHDVAVTPVVKDWDDMLSRFQRLQSKVGAGAGRRGDENAAKLAMAQQDLSQAQRNWSTTVAPQLFTAYDQADRKRVEATKEALAKYATMQNDLGRDSMEVAARILNDIIAWDLDEDVADWLRTVGGGRGGIVEGLSAGRPDGTAALESNRTDGLYVAPSVAGSTLNTNEAAPSIHSARNDRSLGGGLLSKLKPNLSRQRSSSRADSYGNLDLPTRPGLDQSSMNSADTIEGPTPLGRSSGSRMTGAGAEAESLGPDRTASPTEREERRRSFLPNALRRKNSTADRSAARNNRPSHTSVGQFLAPPGIASEEPSSDAGPIVSGSQAPESTTSARIDSEGFSLPPVGHDRQPWHDPTSSLMDDDDRTSHTKTAPLTIQPISVHEGAHERQEAINRVQSTLLSAAPQSIPNRRGSGRDRRAVRSGLFSADEIQGVQAAVSAPVETLTPTENGVTSAIEIPKSSPPRSMPALDSYAASSFIPRSPLSPAHERAMSTMSASGSATSIGNGVALSIFANPDAEGLHAAITETLHMRLRDGVLERANIVGEISMVLRRSASMPVRLRIDNYDMIEKSAPNAAYLKTEGADDGIYSLNSVALAAASVTAPVPVFRYHLRLPPDALDSLSPLHVHPQWKCEATQTSILVNYRALPTTSLIRHVKGKLQGSAMNVPALSQLFLSIPITSSAVGGVQTKPHGAYIQEVKQLQFNLPDLALGSADDHKVLARLSVGEASQAQPISLRWTLPGYLFGGVGLRIEDSSAVPMGETVCLLSGRQIFV